MKEDRKAVIMNNEIARRTSPEEEELARKREELALLQVELAERELFLTSLLRADRLLFTRRSSHRFLLAGVSRKPAGGSEDCTASARTFSAEIRARRRYMRADRFDGL